MLQVVYFTSMFPYLVLTIFFIKGLTLKGASAGLIHMYTPKVSKCTYYSLIVTVRFAVISVLLNTESVIFRV